MTRGAVRGTLFLVLSAAVLAAYVVCLRAPAVAVFHDDGIYIVTAKALAEGKGYRIVSLPGEPAQTKYPFLFPAALAAIWKLYPSFPENAFWLKCLPFGCGLLWAAALWWYFVKKTDNRTMASCIALVTLACPWTLYLSTNVLSETCFALLTTLGLLLLSHVERDSNNGRLGVITAAALFCGAAYLTRSIGLTLLFAALLVLTARRQFKRAMVFGLICLVFVLPWIYWQTIHDVPSDNVEAYYSKVNYRDWNVLGSLPLTDKLRVTVSNLFVAVLTPVTLTGNPAGLGSLVVCLPIVCMTLLGLLVDIRRGFGVLHVWFLLYLLLVITWPWPPPRFLVIAAPFGVYWLIAGVQRVLPRRLREAAPLIVAGVCLLACLPTLLHYCPAIT